MSRSFSIDLTPFALCRTIAGGQKILQRAIGPYEVCQELLGMGYSNLDEYADVCPTRFGVIPELHETLANATLGIPTNARVNIKRMGGKAERLLLTFTY